MSEHRARIIASQWLIHIAELELVEALTAEALKEGLVTHHAEGAAHRANLTGPDKSADSC